MERDFTHEKYRELLLFIRGQGYNFRKFTEFNPADSIVPPCAILRHDVDRLPGRAIKMAMIEQELGIAATFLFRAKPISFDPEIMVKIKGLGHEIGYHYEDLSDARGDFDAAWRSFRHNLEKFSCVGGVRVIGMHGRPLSKWDNRRLWERFDYRNLGIECDPSHEIRWKSFMYFTDVGRSWNGALNLRDGLSGGVKGPPADNTSEVMKLIAESGKNIIINVHPERWTGSILGWFQVLVTDASTNQIKRVVRLARQ
jgi:hypothetical protein